VVINKTELAIKSRQIEIDAFLWFSAAFTIPEATKQMESTPHQSVQA